MQPTSTTEGYHYWHGIVFFFYVFYKKCSRITTMKFIRWDWYSEIQLSYDSVPKFWRHSDQSLNAIWLFFFFLPYFSWTCIRLTLKYKKFALFPDVGQICSPSPRDSVKDIEAKNDAASLQSKRKVNTRTRDTRQGMETCDRGWKPNGGCSTKKRLSWLMILHLFHTEAC